MSVPPGDAPSLPGTLNDNEHFSAVQTERFTSTILHHPNNHTEIHNSQNNTLNKAPSSHVIRINSNPDMTNSNNNENNNISIPIPSTTIPPSILITPPASSLPLSSQIGGEITKITIPPNIATLTPSTSVLSPSAIPNATQVILPVTTAITIKEIPYIPLTLARQTIENIQKDMIMQRERHSKALQDVSRKYSVVEEETKRQFNAFAIKVRQEVADQLHHWKNKSIHAEEQIQDLLTKQQALNADDVARNKIISDLQENIHKAQQEAQKEAQEVVRIHKEVNEFTKTLETTKQQYEIQIQQLNEQIKREGVAHEEAIKKAKDEAAANLLLAQQNDSESSKQQLALIIEKERANFTEQITKYEIKIKELETEKQKYIDLIDKLQQKITSLESKAISLTSTIAVGEANSKILAETPVINTTNTTNNTNTVTVLEDDITELPSSSILTSNVIPTSSIDEPKYVSTAKRIDASRLGLLNYIDKLTSLITHTKTIISTGETNWGEGKKREVLRAYQIEATDLEAILPTNSPTYTIIHNCLLESENKRAEGLIGKAAFILKQGLDSFVNTIENEINTLRAAFIPASSSASTSPSSTSDDLSVVTAALRTKAAEAEARAVDAENRLQEALSRLEAAKEEIENAKASAATGIQDDHDDNTSVASDTEHHEEEHLEHSDTEKDKGHGGKSVTSPSSRAQSTPLSPTKTTPSNLSSPTGSTGAANLTTGAVAAKMKEQEKIIKDLKTKIKQLEVAANKMAATASAKASSGIDEKALTAAVDKAKKEMEKKAKSEREDFEKDAKRELDSVNKKLTKVTTELETLRASLSTVTNERDELKKRTGTLGDLEKEVNTLREAAAEAKTLASALKQATARSEELETLYREEQTLRKRYWNALEDLKGKIRVYARVRPVSQSELDRGNKVIVSFPDEATIDLDTGAKGHKQFVYDRSFGMTTTQDEVFNECENLVQSALDGYNVCIFAYGQTGSGKTHTMVGSKDFPGLTPRAIYRLYDLITKNAGVMDVKVTAYMVELYNDNLVDLFLDNRTASARNTPDPPKLEIKKDDKGVITIKGVTMKDCPSAVSVMELFDVGNNARHVGSTLMNATSSRSHLIFALFIEAFNRQTKRTSVGKISFVDLAGSERVGKTGATAERLKEAQAINKSLSALGNVISALSTNEKFIPYRDNKLTQLLSDGLGGNAKTLMFVNLSPVDYNADESLSSLIYASRVKLITNSAEKQVENAEIQRLKKIITQLRAGNPNAGHDITEEENNTSSGAVLDDTGEVDITE